MLALCVAGCAVPPKPPPPVLTPRTQGPFAHGPSVVDDHVPPFAAYPWEPFSRAAVVAVAQREWRLFGQPIDDDPPDTRPVPPPELKPERMDGLWQRVGEYWWIGQDPGEREVAWTGKHDEFGLEFDAANDANFAWSAAFISYIMRIAGAGADFPYSPNHSTYINAAVRGDSHVLRAYAPQSYAPIPGDLICLGRGRSAVLTFADLPTPDLFPAHCDIVVSANASELSVIGGNVDDAVTLKHIPLGPNGLLVGVDGKTVDQRYGWMVILKVLYAREGGQASLPATPVVGPAPSPAAPPLGGPAPVPAVPQESGKTPLPAAPPASGPTPVPAIPQGSGQMPSPEAPPAGGPAPLPAAPQVSGQVPLPAAPKVAGPAPNAVAPVGNGQASSPTPPVQGGQNQVPATVTGAREAHPPSNP